MEKVEDLGGAVKAMETGYILGDIMETFVKERKAIESGEKVVVRKNKYVVPGEDIYQVWDRLKVHKTDPKSTKKQIERLERVRKERDNRKVSRCLERLRFAAKGKENLMPYLLDAAREYATIGEMTGVLKEVFGVYSDPCTF